MSVICRAACVVVLGTWLVGCYSFTSLGRARTLPKGELELLIASGVTGTATTSGDAEVRPSAEIGARYGVSDRVDLGLRIGDYGASFAARIQLHRAPGTRSGVDVLLAPGLAYTLPDKLALELPCLIGFNLRGDNQIVIAPRVVYQLQFGVGDLNHPAQFVFVGASAAFVWQVSKHVALIPEIGLLEAIYSEPGFTSFTQAGPAFQGALALIWDR